MSKRVLIINDDGYQAKGINLLYQIAKENISDDSWIIAPNENNSAISSALKAGTPFDIIQHDKKIFSITSTPVICFNVGNIMILADKKADIVLSGINCGSNAGLVNRYSGTLAAVMESYMFGIPGIALSQKVSNEFLDHEDDNLAWEVSEYFAPKILQDLIDFVIENMLMVSVNFPKCSVGEVKGIIYAPQDTNTKIVRNLVDLPDGKHVFKDTIFSSELGFNDYSLIQDNYIVITSYSLDWNNIKNSSIVGEFTDKLNSKIICK